MQKRWIIITAIVGLMMGMMMPVGQVAAATAPVQTPMDTETVEINSTVPYTYTAYMTPQNAYGRLRVDGSTTPATFTTVNYDWSTNNAVTRKENEEWPYSYGRVGAAYASNVENPWAAQWIKTETPKYGTGNHSFTYNIDVFMLGDLAVGETKDYSVDVIGNLRDYTINLAIDKAGVYCLFYNSEATLTAANIHLVGPNGLPAYISGSQVLPLAATGGLPIKRFFLIVADQVGKYQFYFTTDTYDMTFELKSYGVTKTLQYDDCVSYTELNDPCPPDFQDCSKFWVHVYAVEAKAFEPFYYNFRLTAQNGASAPMCNYFIMNGTNFGYIINSMSTGANNNGILPLVNGKVFFVIVNNNYFVWTGNLPIRNNVGYRLCIDQIPVDSHQMDNTTTHSVDPRIRFKYVKIDVVNRTGITLNASATTGTATIPINTLIRQDAVLGAVTVTPLQYMYSYGMSVYDLLPGTYWMVITHSMSREDNEFVKIESHKIWDGSVGAKCVSYTDQWTIPSEGALTNHPYIYKDWSNNDAKKNLMPSLTNFTALADWFGIGFNVSLVRSDNPEIFNEVISEYLIWVWNGSQYISYDAANATSVTLFAATYGITHPVYISSRQKFDRVSFKLSTYATSAIYSWSYRSAGATYTSLTALPSWGDSTNNSINTLGQDGTITWDPSTITWSKQATENTGSQLITLPYTAYWIRLSCSEASPASPVLASASDNVVLYRYVDMTVTPQITMAVHSQYDGKTAIPVYNGTTAAIQLNSNTTFSWAKTAENLIDLLFNCTGSIVLLPTQALIYDYRDNPAGVQYQINKTLHLRIQVVNTICWYAQRNYGSLGTPYADYHSINWTTWSTYGYSESINRTELRGILLKVNPGYMYGWYQFLYYSNNSNPANNLMHAIFVNNWIWNLYPNMNNRFLMNSSITLNQTRVMGVPLSTFFILLRPTASNALWLVDVKLNVANYSVGLLMISSAKYAEVFDTKMPLPTWVLPVAIGGGVAVIAVIVGFVIYKKRHPL